MSALSIRSVKAWLRWHRKDRAQWPPFKAERTNPNTLEAYEYSMFSQHGEDGSIRRIFDTIGFQNRTFVEFGFGIYQNNSLRLVMEEGFTGLFLDAQKSEVSLLNSLAKRFDKPGVIAHEAFITCENVESLIGTYIHDGPIDLLSIDVDGNDYWLWEVIEKVVPRVVVIEYNASFGPEVSVTIPYEPKFDRSNPETKNLYHGASLTAMTRLGKRKNYSLVGCDSKGVNAFFVHNDHLVDLLPVQTPKTAFRAHAYRNRKVMNLEDQIRFLQQFPLVTIPEGDVSVDRKDTNSP